MRLKTACCVRNQSACSSDSRMRAARPGSQQWPARPPSARPRKGWGAKARVVDIARGSLTPRGGYNARRCEQRASVRTTRVGANNARGCGLPLRGLRAAARGPSPPVLLGVAHKGRNQATWHRTQGRNQALVCGGCFVNRGPCVRNPGEGTQPGKKRTTGGGARSLGGAGPGPGHGRADGTRHPSGRQLRSPGSRRTRHPAPSHGVGVTRCASTRRPPHRRGPPRPRRPGRRRGRRSPPSPPTRP